LDGLDRNVSDGPAHGKPARSITLDYRISASSTASQISCGRILLLPQHGHRGKVLAIALAKRMRMVAIEFGM